MGEDTFTVKEVLVDIQKDVKEIKGSMENQVIRVVKLEDAVKDIPTMKVDIKNLQDYAISQKSGLNIFKTYALPVIISIATLLVGNYITDKIQALSHINQVYEIR